MIKELKRKFPKWIETTEGNPLIMSDDIDSLMSCIFLRDNFNCKVRYFYDSNKPFYTHLLYKRKGFDYKLQDKKAIAVDLALESYYAWDNHVIKYLENDTYNKNSANLNAINGICSQNYTEKWCVSTYITLLSYYNIDIEKWTKEQLAILCAIDGLYTPFKNTTFKTIASKHLEQLEYGFLIKFIENNIEYIEKIKKDLNLDGKIKVKDGKLATDIKLDELSKIFGIDISLPKCTMQLKRTLNKEFKNNISKKNIKQYFCNNKTIHNFALVRKNRVVYSY